MSSPSEENDAGANHHLDLPALHDNSDAESFSRTRPAEADDLVEETESVGPELNGTAFHNYGKVIAANGTEEAEGSSTLSPPARDVASPDETISVQDDSPSIRVCCCDVPKITPSS
jgi:hypothetical protein